MTDSYADDLANYLALTVDNEDSRNDTQHSDAKHGNDEASPTRHELGQQPADSTTCADNASYAEQPRYIYDEASGYSYDTHQQQWMWYDASTGYYIPAEDLLRGATEPEPESTATIRIVVKTSRVLPVGGVAVVDGNGLILARDRGTGRRLRLAELAVSKYHAHIYHQQKQPSASDAEEEDAAAEASDFWLVDSGSLHGTCVNEERLSAPRVSSAPRRLQHRDIISIGGTELEVHVHDATRGWGSCGACTLRDDNALSIHWEQTATASARQAPKERGDRRVALETERRAELQRLRSKYTGASASGKATQPRGSPSAAYRDRAALRRAHTDASDTPTDANISSREVEMAVAVPAERNGGPLDARNLGHRMLTRMGWSPDAAMTEPVAVGLERHTERAGLGSDSTTRIADDDESRRSKAIRLARQRYKHLI